jgi:polyisoprenoid-binding protein YceI
MAKWAIDPYHSMAYFQIRHMMTRVRGQMGIKEGWIEEDGQDLSTAKVEVVLDPNTVNTGIEYRDNHLRSPDGHFDVQQFPAITFMSKKIEGSDPTNFKIVGDLTIRGKTREVVLDASFGGEGKGSKGERRASFSAATRINRRDFDLTWNQVLESGGLVLGDDVKVELEVEATPAQTPEEATAKTAAAARAEAR